KYQAKQIINLDGEKFISAGWIDIHTHCYERLDLYKDYPDEVGMSISARAAQFGAPIIVTGNELDANAEKLLKGKELEIVGGENS
ncbi:hypothetical protein ACTPEF_25845, partial [Clostridioides difficile]